MKNSLESREKSELYMDTVVKIKVVTSRPRNEVNASIQAAFQSFRDVEEACSRFVEDSEVIRLSSQVDVPIKVSPILFEAAHFACTVADSTGGAFDPTIGRTMEAYGFNRHYLSGKKSNSTIDPNSPVSYQDVDLDIRNRTILLRRPLILDLGAVAKGLAIDLAAKEFLQDEGVVIDAGGDLYARGSNEFNEPWAIGIRHPVDRNRLFCSLRLSDAAVCTSGSYERVSPNKSGQHHLIDPRSRESRADLLSCTVVAPFAMMADALSTSAFILGIERGIEFLEDTGAEGLLIGSDLHMHLSKGMDRHLPTHPAPKAQCDTVDG